MCNYCWGPLPEEEKEEGGPGCLILIILLLLAIAYFSLVIGPQG